MKRDEEITGMLKQLKDLSEKLLRYLGNERMSYQMICDDYDVLRKKNIELVNLNDEIIKSNNGLRSEGETIIKNAKSEAERITSLANDSLIMARKEKVKSEELRNKTEREVRIKKKELAELAGIDEKN